MSTEYTNIKSHKTLLMTRFAGGIDRGVCLQVTELNGLQSAYIQLTHKDAIKLKKQLNKFIELKAKNIAYVLCDGFYLTLIQAKQLYVDLDLFINDKIHK